MLDCDVEIFDVHIHCVNQRADRSPHTPKENQRMTNAPKISRKQVRGSRVRVGR